MILLKLKRIAEDSTINLKVSYEDRNGNIESDEATVVFEDEEPEFFANSGIRKGILLARYANLIKNWLIDEREHVNLSELWEPSVNPETGIIVPPSILGQWERRSLPLFVSPLYLCHRYIGRYFRSLANTFSTKWRQLVMKHLIKSLRFSKC